MPTTEQQTAGERSRGPRDPQQAQATAPAEMGIAEAIARALAHLLMSFFCDLDEPDAKARLRKGMLMFSARGRDPGIHVRPRDLFHETKREMCAAGARVPTEREISEEARLFGHDPEDNPDPVRQRRLVPYGGASIRTYRFLPAITLEWLQIFKLDTHDVRRRIEWLDRRMTEAQAKAPAPKRRRTAPARPEPDEQEISPEAVAEFEQAEAEGAARYHEAVARLRRDGPTTEGYGQKSPTVFVAPGDRETPMRGYYPGARASSFDRSSDTLAVRWHEIRALVPEDPKEPILLVVEHVSKVPREGHKWVMSAGDGLSVEQVLTARYPAAGLLPVYVDPAVEPSVARRAMIARDLREGYAKAAADVIAQIYEKQNHDRQARRRARV